uniref:Uncharacterized protein n=1 Tax=Lotharella globosa TaxID=91324 RepID=A0A7S3ZGR5_9EUKA|mmetsp:Transcript_13709/g.26028  ORF Transcript_13709/g.26028 Transcript_13709/m.26028 type:complete len:132 (+) Transcript_13709:71-466(+)
MMLRRLLGKVNEETLFESKVDNPWDKHGAEGLVFYTDAVVWDAKKGDFDERTTDAWDVDASILEFLESRGDECNRKQDSNNERATTKKKTGEERFVDGQLPRDYKPTTIYDVEPERQPTESEAMGSFKLLD